jgi:hypothetical protein
LTKLGLRQLAQSLPAIISAMKTEFALERMVRPD